MSVIIQRGHLDLLNETTYIDSIACEEDDGPYSTQRGPEL
jgi:hypothetical protein